MIVNSDWGSRGPSSIYTAMSSSLRSRGRAEMPTFRACARNV